VTPTVVHFGSALVLSGLLTAPWEGLAAPMLLAALGGAAGFIYIVVVAWRLRTLHAYS
jgi:hypothetical protein